MINVSVVTRVFPVTGIPLTFISFGGTSLMMSLFSIGVILNISKYNALAYRKKQKEDVKEGVA
jgi:cell division protein FtsW